jgi:hypothetical protein
MDLRFNEIEHKYIVDDRFDLGRFRETVDALGPTRTASLHVQDRYYLTEAGRKQRVVIRHRYDAELHHLTVKSLAADTEVRVEVNLDLGHHAGDQQAQVDAFVGQLGILWSGSIEKALEVWDFPDCEVVYYQASAEGRSVRCVEFEAVQKGSVPGALAVLEKYERATGFECACRSRQPLLEILFPRVTELLDSF